MFSSLLSKHDARTAPQLAVVPISVLVLALAQLRKVVAVIPKITATDVFGLDSKHGHGAGLAIKRQVPLKLVWRLVAVVVGLYLPAFLNLTMPALSICLPSRSISNRASYTPKMRKYMVNTYPLLIYE